MKKHKPATQKHKTKEKHKHTAHKRKSKMSVWQISTIILGILLVISVFTGGFNGTKSADGTGQEVTDSTNPESASLTGQAVADKAIEFINQNLLQGQATATLESVVESRGLYNLKLNINGQELDSYATKDGQMFFPQAIDLSEPPEAPQQAPPQDIQKTDTPNVKLFTMSFCPYGNQAEEAMHPVAELLKDKVDVEPHYVIYNNYRGGGPQYCLDEENKYCSMHGIQELNQDVRELCVYKYQKDKFWDFVMKINEKCSAEDVDSCWEAIAEEQGIDTEQIKSCQQNEAMDILKTEAELNTQYGVKGSPTLVINDATYNGGRTSEAYKQAVCSAFTAEPGECSEALSESASSAPTGGCG